MTEEMTFNGVGMSRFFRVREVVRAIGNDRNISQVDAPLIGTNIQKVSFGAKKITVSFTMLEKTATEIEALKHELAGALHVKEPARLTFEDEPDKYYMAIPTGDVSIG
ncbi:MAG: phage tail protein, partial [Streptococcus sp.]